MTVEEETKLTITVIGDDIDTFKSGLQKVCDDLKRIGIKHVGMTTEEADLIKKLNDNLK